LYLNANAIFEHLKENNFVILISTVAVAEFCTKDDFNVLPWKVLTPIVFDMSHALRAAEFANKIFAAKKRCYFNATKYYSE